jgi:enoyl-CoA hydratase/carnithine racemase
MAALEYSATGGVGRLTINRPEKRNALTFEVMQGMRDALARAATDDDIRVVVVAGAGEKAFCAGADLGSTMSAGEAAAHDARGMLADVFRTMWSMGKPSIARVHGYALAGGFGLAMACDFVVAADDAVLGTPEIDVGLWPHMITVPLLRSLPPRVVLELITTGRRISPDELHRHGAINRVVPIDGLDAAVDELAATLASKSPIAMRYGLRGFRRAQEMTDDAALDMLQAMLTVTTHTEDAAEGVAAFAEKRAPVWKGR